MARLRADWSAIISAVDWLLLFYLRTTNPKYVVVVFLMFNLTVSCVAILGTDKWLDWYTASGYWVTVTGFLVAIGELYRARTTTDQIGAALENEARSHRRRFYRFCLDRTKITLSYIQAHVERYEWTLAVSRLRDLIENLSHVQFISPAADDRWDRLSTSLKDWVIIFTSGYNGRKHNYNHTDWQTLDHIADGNLNSELAPFQFGEEVGNAS